MSDATLALLEEKDARIKQLDNETRAAQELLFLVLDEIGSPVSFDIVEAREKLRTDRVIDVQLDNSKNFWTLQVVDINDQ